MAVPEHRRLQRAALDTEAAAQRALFAGDWDRARDGFRDAVALYRESYASAPPGATGRLIGMLKAAVIAGVDPEAAAWAEPRLRDEEDGPVKSYGMAICRLIEGAEDALPAHAAAMREGSPPFQRAASAIEAIAGRSSERYADAVAAIVRDFEGRRHHVTRVPIADTALLLEIFAERRGMAARPSSPLLPARSPDTAEAVANRQ